MCCNEKMHNIMYYSVYIWLPANFQCLKFKAFGQQKMAEMFKSQPYIWLLHYWSFLMAKYFFAGDLYRASARIVATTIPTVNCPMFHGIPMAATAQFP